MIFIQLFQSSKDSLLCFKVPVDKDLHLVTRLQNKVKELEKEKARLRRELDRKEDGKYAANGEIQEESIFETIKVQELEMENSKLKTDLEKLQQSVVESQSGADGSPVSKELMGMYKEEVTPCM